MTRWRLVAAIAAIVLVAGGPSRAEPLVADLSSHRIAIESGFTGAEVLLYGAIEDEGDLVVVVRGPMERIVVRRKDRILGVWMNRDKMIFVGVPAFYAVASSRPLDEIARAPLLALHRIGLDTLRLTALTTRPPKEIKPFHDALMRNRVRDGLYKAEPGKVSFVGKRLFRTKLRFPGNVPTGTYNTQVFLIRDGAVVSAETTPLFISKSGLEAEINYFARAQPAYYGITAIILALAAGWIAAVVFRKV